MERERNRTLRRADWRFLLPDPHPATSVCFARGLLATAVARISDRAVDRRNPPPGTCDLAVAVNPDRATVRAAWSALRVGGSCYTEWYSPLTGGPSGVRRRLEAAGFEDVVCYWAWPLPSRAPSVVWLPLESAGAVAYLLASRPKARRFARRTYDAARMALWRLGARTGRLIPICAVARKPAPSHGPHAVAPEPTGDTRATSASRTDAGLLDTVRARWGDWGLGPVPDHCSWLLLTGGPRSISKVVGLLFAGADRRPTLAVKMPRVPESALPLINEASALRAVQSLRSGGVAGVPRLLFSEERAGLLTVGETALTGTPLHEALDPATYRDLALKATAWLADLAGKAAPVPASGWWDRLVEPVFADFCASFGPVVDAASLRETRAILGGLASLPLVLEHRDFAPWNVLLDAAGQLVVLDWESSERRGLPALDLIYFVSYLAFFLEGSIHTGNMVASYRATLRPDSFTGGVRHECLARYASKIGVDVAALRPLRLLVWLIHSRSEYQRFVADAAGTPTPETLRGSVFLGFFSEELRALTAQPTA